MDFSITPKQKEIIDLARTIAQEEIKPASLAIDKSGVIPEGLMRILKQSGMTALAVPKEYGGAGQDVLSYAIAVEELSRVDGGTGVILSAHVSLGSWPIFAFGTEEQKQKWLTHWLLSQFLSGVMKNRSRPGVIR